MRLHRFHIPDPVGTKTELTLHSAGLVNQIHRVFRLKKGDSVIVFDGSGSDYTCRIEDLGKTSITLAVIEASKSRFMPSQELILCAAIVKKDTFEWITEKATELGVTTIIPVIAERSEKKALNEERLKKIAIEASEQSGRGNVPRIEQVVSLREVVDSMVKEEGKRKMTAFHTEGEAFGSEDILNNESVAVFIGPEGGWSPDELDLFHRNEIPIRCLGQQILRAETAVVAALSQIVFTR